MRLPHWLDLPGLPGVLTHGFGLVLLVVLALMLYTALTAVIASVVIGWVKSRGTGALPLLEAGSVARRHRRVVPARRKPPENLRRAS